MQDRVAERAFYDQLFESNPENEHIVAGYEEIHEFAFGKDTPRGIVLDIGCGTGGHAIRLAERGLDVVAMDLTRQGAKSARERFRRAGKHGRFLVADAEHLPFRDGVADVAWTSLLLHHFPTLDDLLPELRRVTRRRVIAFEPNAQNALTWFAFNVVNKTVGIAGMTPNQKALLPGSLDRLFARVGMRRVALHYVARGWSDNAAGVRRAYEAVTSLLPERFQANKFLIIYEKTGAS